MVCPKLCGLGWPSLLLFQQLHNGSWFGKASLLTLWVTSSLPMPSSWMWQRRILPHRETLFFSLVSLLQLSALWHSITTARTQFLSCLGISLNCHLTNSILQVQQHQGAIWYSFVSKSPVKSLSFPLEIDRSNSAEEHCKIGISWGIPLVPLFSTCMLPEQSNFLNFGDSATERHALLVHRTFWRQLLDLLVVATLV